MRLLILFVVMLMTIFAYAKDPNIQVSSCQVIKVTSANTFIATCMFETKAKLVSVRLIGNVPFDEADSKSVREQMDFSGFSLEDQIKENKRSNSFLSMVFDSREDVCIAINPKHPIWNKHINAVVFTESCNNVYFGETMSLNEYMISYAMSDLRWMYPRKDFNSLEKIIFSPFNE